MCILEEAKMFAPCKALTEKKGVTTGYVQNTRTAEEYVAQLDGRNPPNIINLVSIHMLVQSTLYEV